MKGVLLVVAVVGACRVNFEIAPEVAHRIADEGVLEEEGEAPERLPDEFRATIRAKEDVRLGTMSTFGARCQRAEVVHESSVDEARGAGLSFEEIEFDRRSAFRPFGGWWQISDVDGRCVVVPAGAVESIHVVDEGARSQRTAGIVIGSVLGGGAAVAVAIVIATSLNPY